MQSESNPLGPVSLNISKHTISPAAGPWLCASTCGGSNRHRVLGSGDMSSHQFTVLACALDQTNINTSSCKSRGGYFEDGGAGYFLLFVLLTFQDKRLHLVFEWLEVFCFGVRAHPLNVLFAGWGSRTGTHYRFPGVHSKNVHHHIQIKV